MTLYDWPEVYDAWFGWDPATEVDFVLAASARWGIGRPVRILEPFCGTGRLLRAMPGAVLGFDLHAGALRYARARGCRVFRADAARFAVVPGSFGLAFNHIDSFRHLLTQEAALGHLRCVARALRPGAVYVLGLDVTGDMAGPMAPEEWESERDGLHVEGAVAALGDADPETRVETFRTRCTVRRGKERFEIEAFAPLRVYSRRQLEDLIDDEGSFEIAAICDRHYDPARTMELAQVEGSAVLVLQRT